MPDAMPLFKRHLMPKVKRRRLPLNRGASPDRVLTSMERVYEFIQSLALIFLLLSTWA